MVAERRSPPTAPVLADDGARKKPAVEEDVGAISDGEAGRGLRMVVSPIGNEIKDRVRGSHKAVCMKMQRGGVAEAQPNAAVVKTEFVDVDHVGLVDVHCLVSREPVEYRYIASDSRVRSRGTSVCHNPVARRCPAAAIGVVPIVEHLVCKKSGAHDNGKYSNHHACSKGSRSGHCLFHILPPLMNEIAIGRIGCARSEAKYTAALSDEI